MHLIISKRRHPLHKIYGETTSTLVPETAHDNTDVGTHDETTSHYNRNEPGTVKCVRNLWNKIKYTYPQTYEKMWRPFKFIHNPRLNAALIKTQMK